MEYRLGSLAILLNARKILFWLWLLLLLTSSLFSISGTQRTSPPLPSGSSSGKNVRNLSIESLGNTAVRKNAAAALSTTTNRNGVLVRQEDDDSLGTTTTSLGPNLFPQVAHTVQTQRTTPRVNTTDTPLTRIFVLGERNSGTNFVSRLLDRFFPNYGGMQNTSPRHARFALGIPVLEFKHLVGTRRRKR